MRTLIFLICFLTSGALADTPPPPPLYLISNPTPPATPLSGFRLWLDSGGSLEVLNSSGSSTPSATPGGSTGAVQFNTGGAFNGNTARLLWDNSANKLKVKGTLELDGATSGNVSFISPAVATPTTYTLPSADGSSGQAITTDGSSNLGWSNIVANPMAADLNANEHRITTASSIDNNVYTPATTPFTAGSTPPIYLATDGTHPNELNITNIGNNLPINTPFTLIGTNLPAPLVQGTTYYSSGGGVGTGLGQDSIYIWSALGGPVVPITSLGSGSVTLNYQVVTPGTLTINSPTVMGGDLDISGFNLIAPNARIDSILQVFGNAGINVSGQALLGPGGTNMLFWGGGSLDVNRHDMTNVTRILARTGFGDNIIITPDNGQPVIIGQAVAATPNPLIFYDGTGTSTVGFVAPTIVTASVAWVLPPADGQTSSLLMTDGATNLSWATQINYIGGAEFIDLNLGNIFDDSGVIDISPNQRALKNSGGVGTVDWDQLQLSGNWTIAGQLLFSANPTGVSSCGTGASINGNDSSGTVTIGSGTNTCTLTFNSTWANAPACTVTEQTTPLVLAAKSTTTTLVITSFGAALTSTNFGTGDLISYNCSSL